MARPKKTAEMEVVFNNLKNATYDELVSVKAECEKLIDKAKKAEIEAKKAEIEKLKKELAELEK